MNVLKICENEMLLKNNLSDRDIDKDKSMLYNDLQKLRNKSQKLRNGAQVIRNKSLLVRNESQKLRSEVQVLRNESQVLRNEAQVIRSGIQKPKNKPLPAGNESQVLRNKSQKLRSDEQVIRNQLKVHRNTLFEPDEKICMPLIESKKTYNDLDGVLDIPLFEDIETDNNSDSDDDLNITLFDDIEKDNELFEPDEESNYMDIEQKEDNKERTIHLDKVNDLIDQASMLAKTRNNFSKNVDDVCMLMNELHNEIYSDDAWLRFVELNKISTLLDQSFDYV